MEYQSLLHKKLLDKVFVFTAETTPPDASDTETLLKNVMPLKGVADAVNVTAVSYTHLTLPTICSV